jgi:cytochrome P450
MPVANRPQATRPSLSVPPGPRGWPGLGSLLAFNRDAPGFLTRLYQDYGEVSSFTAAGLRLSFFAHPRAVKEILVDHPRDYTQSEAYPELQQLVGDGLLSLDGEAHRQQRRLVQPAFHRTRVERYADSVVARARDLADSWAPGETVDVAAAMQQLTLKVVGDSLFGLNLGDQSDVIAKSFLAAGEYVLLPLVSLARLPVNLPFLPYGQFLRARQSLDRVVDAIIASRRAEERDRGDVLSLLLTARTEDDTGLDDRQIRSHILTFLGAGYATTANALTWTFYLLAENPRVLTRLAAELAQVLGGRLPTAADLAQLPYLDQVVKESLRLYPPAWVQLRRARTAVTLEGYSLPAGSFVMVSQWVTHRRPDLWPAADQFIPERFDPARADEPPPLAYFPFGAGPRTCIGMPFALLETRLVLATLLQRVHPAAVVGGPVVPRALIVLMPRDGLRVTLAPARAPAEAAVTMATAPRAIDDRSGRWHNLPGAEPSSTERRPSAEGTESI